MNTKFFVKLIIGAIYFDRQILEYSKEKMRQLKLKVVFQSDEFDFNLTEYYAAEMGNDLKRCFLSTEGLQKIETVFEWKLKMVEIENYLRQNGKRRINLDPGYIDYHRLVLLSSKEGAQKIYLRKGIWADLVLLKDKYGYKELPWTFPDIKDGRYNDFFLKVHKKFKEENKF